VGLRDVPPGIEALIRSCLGKYPEERPKSAWELALAYEKALGRRLVGGRATSGGAPRSPGSSSGAFPAVSRAAALAAPAAPMGVPAVDRNAVQHTVEAIMPEVMAMMKLRGFIGDLGGEVIESVPGLIRVRLGEPQEKPRSGLFAILGGGGGRGNGVMTKQQATDLELHMERKDPTQPNRLTVSLVMRPAGGMISTNDWRERCNRIGRDLQAYLMGR
jgi:serine/threonine-protein kinase